MSSRQEEKQRRRDERMAQEAAARSAARGRRLRMTASGAVAVAAVAAVVIAIAAGSGGGGGGGVKPAGKDLRTAPIPAAKTKELTAAARTAGCTVRSFRDEGREHTTSTVRYRTDPPTSGNHDPVPADDGAYEGGNTPAIGHLVHALEHGRVEIQYRPGLPRRQIAQLSSLFDEKGGYHTLLFENRTRMRYAVAATAWTRLIGCPRFTPAVFDALRDFRAAYTDKGPEFVP